jgi:uncharacterized protein YbdZ (MbtH family)
MSEDTRYQVVIQVVINDEEQDSIWPELSLRRALDGIDS